MVNVDLFNPNLSFTFATPQTSVSFWYITADGFNGVATLADGTTQTFSGSNAGYNSHAVLGNPATYSTYTQEALANTSGNSMKNIVSVALTDDDGLGDLTSIDDLSAPGITGQPTPDAASTLGLFGVSALALLAFRNQLARR